MHDILRKEISNRSNRKGEVRNMEGKGALFKNDKKESNKHPDYTGSMEIDGNKYRLAAWVTKSKAGKPYMSVKLSEPQQKEFVPQQIQDDPVDLSGIPF